MSSVQCLPRHGHSMRRHAMFRGDFDYREKSVFRLRRLSTGMAYRVRYAEVTVFGDVACCARWNVCCGVCIVEFVQGGLRQILTTGAESPL